MSKILLMGSNGFYNVARQEPKHGLILEPDSTHERIDARKTIPYGFVFNFGSGTGIDFDIKGYTNQIYREMEKVKGMFSTKHEDYGRVNLQMAIEGLEKITEEKGADFILVDLHSTDMGTHWDINGRAQFLLYNK
jgi:hypothetical protein